jgi:hypothetical protein
MKVMCTQYVPQPYETMQTVFKTETRVEKFTAYRCEVTPTVQTRQVTVYNTVPETRNVVVTRMECVPSVEERTVTRMVASTQPVTTMVSRCVDRGGHYECRVVPCDDGGRKHRRHHKRGGCEEECCPPPVKTVSVYVPNMVTEQVPCTTYRTVCTPVAEKVRVTVMKAVPRQETVPVTTYKCVPTVQNQNVTVMVSKQVPYEATRNVCVSVPVQQKVTLTRMVPVQVEKEVTCYTGGGECGGGECGGRTHRCGRKHARGHRGHGGCGDC